MSRSRRTGSDRHARGQLGLIPIEQAYCLHTPTSIPCPVCRETHTEEIDRDLWECPECWHQWRAEIEEHR